MWAVARAWATPHLPGTPRVTVKRVWPKAAKEHNTNGWSRVEVGLLGFNVIHLQIPEGCDDCRAQLLGSKSRRGGAQGHSVS